MKRLIFFLVFIFGMELLAEDVTVAAKQKKESCNKIKENLAEELEVELKLSTDSIRKLTDLIDRIGGEIKQLLGQEDGELNCSNKKSLAFFREKVKKNNQLLKNLKQELVLD